MHPRSQALSLFLGSRKRKEPGNKHSCSNMADVWEEKAEAEEADLDYRKMKQTHQVVKYVIY